MFKYYLKTAFRNLLRFKTISLINITGLTIGITVCTLLLLYVQDELSFDNFHKDSDNIYRILRESPYTAPQLSKLLKDNFPEIIETTRILPQDEKYVKHRERRYIEKSFAYVDPGFFKVFSFKLKRGDSETALKHPFSIVITEKMAKKYFDEESPIGKTLRIDTSHDYTITGILEEMPQNSHFRYDIMATLVDGEKVFGKLIHNWGWQNFITYLRFGNKISKSDFEAKCTTLIAQHRKSRPGDKKNNYSLQPLKDIHLYSAHMDNDIAPQGNITYVLILSTIGILIILIACCNYINLFTANAAARMNDVGIRKVVGATVRQLTGQFVFESILLVMITFLLSLILVEAFLPGFNALTGKHFSSVGLFTVNNLLGIVVIVFLTGLISSLYPALTLSSLQPVKIIRGSRASSKDRTGLRKILVGFQFTVSIVLIICAMLMLRQLDYLENKQLGFKKEYVAAAEVQDFGNLSKYRSLKNTLLQDPNITAVSSASRIPSDTWTNYSGFLPEGQSETIGMPIGHVNFDYFETLGIEPVKGRLFSEKMRTDATEAIILNESAVKKLGLSHTPLGTSIFVSWPKSNRRVIGIVKDLHLESLHEKINPVAFVISPTNCWKLMVKMKSTNVHKTMKQMTRTGNAFYPDLIFDFKFLDDRIDSLYGSERRAFRMMGYFTLIAIFIASLGLFGLATFSTKRRRKEIGIRKIHGASGINIIIMLSMEFLKGVVVAFIIACPVAYYSMNRWLQNFAYRAEISWWIFVVGGMIALGITLLTVNWQILQAARINPVDTLRCK
ncbi:MAG: ABC transporter permease [Candidatus Aminicenantes bacterium]|nr:ABC transporter permease [Candidatus Aminicenantes bacterium]